MESLPNELRHDILQHLAIEDVKSIRLASKDWGRLGADYLMKPTFYASRHSHRNDFTRLLQVSRHPVLESHVKHITFNMAEMNDYQARHNIYFLNYTRDSEIRRQLLEEAWKDYAFVDSRKSLYASDCCNPTILDEAFGNFSRVKSLEIRMTECPFENELLQRLWKVPSTIQAHRNIDSERFARILSACTTLKVETLIHDRLSLEFFRQELASLKLQFSGLSDLRKLELDLVHAALEEDEFQSMVANFSRCLQSMENLHSLHIGFKRREQHSRVMSPYIVECTWKNLHTLHLSGITVSHTELLDFLERHASSLRNFQLGKANIRTAHLSSPEFYGNEICGSTGKDFFMALSRNLKLDRFDLRGAFRFRHAAVQVYGEPDPIEEEDNWDLEKSTDTKSSLEHFVVEGGEWPEIPELRPSI